MRKLATALLAAAAALTACSPIATQTVTVTAGASTSGTSTAAATSTAATTPSPAALHTYTARQEGLTFSYPATWTLRPGTTIGPQDEAVVLTSPAGTEIRLNTDVEGIGGACPPGSQPDVLITAVTPSPHISRASIVTTVVRGKGTQIALSGPQPGDPAPTPGDTGSCFDVPSGMTRSHPSNGRIWFYSRRPTAPADTDAVIAILSSATY
jgi:hypothetical protein